MERINSSYQVHEGTQSFAGRGEQLVSISSENTRQQGLKHSRWDLGKMLGRAAEVQGDDPQDLECVEGIIIIIFWN